VNVGTRSLLWGVHAFWWHPLVVARAWRALYGRWPTWREAICIAVHDVGYWGVPAMDDERGERHPLAGARIATRLLGPKYGRLALLHSRHFARRVGRPPSALCWPDKLSIVYEPAWWYLLRARLSGELAQYRATAADAGVVPLSASDGEWFGILRARAERLAREQRADVVIYMNPFRSDGAGR
jgi:hypothetical protein